MDVVYHVTDYVALKAIAVQLGFVKDDKIVVNGNIQSGGEYFLNHVGTVYQPTGATTTNAFGDVVPVVAPLPGEFGRLRLNGATPFLETLPPGAPLTVYHYDRNLGGWTTDGVTLAPDYIGNIGIIA